MPQLLGVYLFGMSWQRSTIHFNKKKIPHNIVYYPFKMKIPSTHPCVSSSIYNLFRLVQTCSDLSRSIYANQATSEWMNELGISQQRSCKQIVQTDFVYTFNEFISIVCVCMYVFRGRRHGHKNKDIIIIDAWNFPGKFFLPKKNFNFHNTGPATEILNTWSKKIFITSIPHCISICIKNTDYLYLEFLYT